MLLEVIVQSVDDARAAEAGGADRLEVVREIERDGLSPSVDLVRAIRAATSLPLRVMVRESDGFSVGSDDELETLKEAFAAFAALRVDGAVVGFTRDRALDADLMQQVMSAAPGLAVTLHRAFDHVHDRLAAIDSARMLPQVDRILTDGGGGDWSLRCERLRQYAGRAGDRLKILAGGGVDETALRRLASARVVSEVHVGRAARDPQVATAPVSAARVAHLRTILISPGSDALNRA
jgi:copper homeostasis protein